MVLRAFVVAIWFIYVIIHPKKWFRLSERVSNREAYSYSYHKNGGVDSRWEHGYIGLNWSILAIKFLNTIHRTLISLRWRCLIEKDAAGLY